MKKTLILAAPLVALAACASPNGGAPSAAAPVAAASSAGALHCWQSRLNVERDGYSCNWAPSAAAACGSSGRSHVEKRAIASGPRKGGRCDNGEWLVTVTTG